MPGIYVWVKNSFPCEFWNLACVFGNVYCMELYKSSVLGIQNSRIVELFTVHIDIQLGILQCIRLVLSNRKYPYFTDVYQICQKIPFKRLLLRIALTSYSFHTCLDLKSCLDFFCKKLQFTRRNNCQMNICELDLNI